MLNAPRVLSIPRLDLTKHVTDVEAFYREHAGRPVILEGLTALPGFCELNVEVVSQAIAGTLLWAEDMLTGVKQFVPADAMLAAHAHGESRFNVYESPLLGTPLEAQVPLPLFARDN